MSPGHFCLRMLLALPLLCLAAANASAATRYVKHDASGANNGSSWADAFTTLQPAIAAATSGDEVWVATGTYKPTSWPNGGSTDREMHFSLKNGVAVYGGFAGTETLLNERDPANNPVILSGDIGVAGSTADNCYHIFYHPNGLNLDGTAILDGFTVTAGNANGSSSHSSGGGMYNYSSSPSIADCIFSGNTASSRGGGIYNYSQSSPLITQCVFIENHSLSYGGGGIYNGFYSSPTINGCAFKENMAIANNGGGIHCESSYPYIINCQFSRNMARDGGGFYGNASSITNCYFNENTAVNGGGMFILYTSAVLNNCTFYDNHASNFGGGIYCSESLSIKNCTIVNNKASKGGGLYNYSAPSVQNSAFWRNLPDQIGQNNAGGIISYCVVEGGFAVGTNIITVDPLLMPPADNGGPTMTCAMPSGSSAIAIPESAGGGSWNGCLDNDQRGFARPTSGLRAIGAYQPGAGRPALRTEPITNNAGISADSGGVFIDQGSSYSVVAKGLCWGTCENPTASDNYVECGYGFDDFSGTISGLIPGVSYHIRAYAQLDDGGTVYGQDIRFKATRLAHVVPGGVGSMDGSSWDNAYADPQIAIENATEVWIAAGTYVPQSWPNGGATEREKHFSLRNDTTVYGGFNGTETLLNERNIAAHPVTLSGDIGIPGDNADNCFHVLYHPSDLRLDATAILDGIAISRGNASGDVNIRYAENGGGIYNYNCSPAIVNCAVNDNSAQNGGGMYNWFSTPIIARCSFTDNHASQGGGLYNSCSSFDLSDCTIQGNFGGGVYYKQCSLPTMNRCNIVDNYGLNGGGVNASGPGIIMVSITDCTFQGNRADWGGGYYSTYKTKIANCSFLFNQASDGGGIYITAATVTNSTFYKNFAEYGGGVFNLDDRADIINCTLVDNFAVYGGGIRNNGTSPVIKNSIFWGNYPDQTQGGNPVLSYCVVQDGYAAGANVITDDPLLGPLVNNGETTMTCAIPTDSPAVAIPEAAGTGNWNGCPNFDQRGYARPASGFRAIGAYEPGVGMPTLQTEPITGNAGSDATSGGTFIDQGSGYSVVAKGLCWGTTENPTLADSHVECGAGFAPFSSTMTGIIPGLVNHVRAYAQLDDGSTIYGQDIRFRNYRKAYVVPGGAGIMDGSSWVDAYADPQAAMDNASEVWVATGTYTPISWPNGGNEEREKHFSLKTGVAIYGGFAGTETLLSERSVTANPTILSGDIGVPGDNSDNCYHVFYHPWETNLSADVILDGFTVTRGNADGQDHINGGGMCNELVSPTISNCRFVENTASRDGGGLYHAYTLPTVLSACSFVGNMSGNNGGGMCQIGTPTTISLCDFANNSAHKGGGVMSIGASLAILDCAFANNAAGLGGGISNSSILSIARTSFTSNTAIFDGTTCKGGGIYNDSVTATIADCTFVGNSAVVSAGSNGGGGGMFHESKAFPLITNCTFYKNSATGTSSDGGGIYLRGNASMLNCTFVGNSTKGTGGGIYAFSSSATVRNSILWGNIPQQISGSTPSLSYCAVEGGFAGGTDIITNDPLIGPLADSGGPTMTCAIPPDSPSVTIPKLAGAGDWNGCPDNDQRGFARPTSGFRAIGAYEPGVGKPALRTNQIANNFEGSADSGGTFIDQGSGYSIVAKGLCWGTSENPSMLDNHVECGSGFDGFSGTIVGLVPFVQYHVRAYAELDDGSFIYGHDVRFTAHLRAYVVPGGVGSTDGSSWDNAYADLQVAIENATEVWVAAGTYMPQSWPNGGTAEREKHFSLRNDTFVYGGFAGTETLLSERNVSANPTILSGDIGVVGTTSDNCYHVFYHPNGLNLDASAILDGFIIAAGNANGSSPHNRGAGMYNNTSSPAIINCTFSDNTASSNGGGIYNVTLSFPTITDCTFNGNAASSSGGGIYNISSSPAITNCTFSSNTANTYGGGIANYSSSSPAIINCTFSGNTATTSGGGIYNSTSSPVIKNCILWGNSSGQISGGTPSVSYCVIQGGFASGSNIITTNPLLGSLADNGGPTMTCAIPVNSSAVAIPEATGGNWNGCPDTDQRGFARPASGLRAIGAYQPGVGKPALRTEAATEITGHEATAGGAFIDPGSGYTVIATGLCWATSEYPTVANPHVACGTGFDDFSGTMTGLAHFTVYYARAYAQLDDGSVVYGQNISFKTGKTARVYVVPGGAGIMDGTSWGNAYADPQVGIERAFEVWIAAGTYLPQSWPRGGTTTSRYRHFSLFNGVTVRGGFNGTEITLEQRDIAANPVIFSGDIGIPDSIFDNCYHVFYHPASANLDHTAILEGVAIANGNADVNTGVRGQGGGMYNSASSPYLANCTFRDNFASGTTADGGGGGIYNTSSSPTIINCSFVNNQAITSSGGAIRNLRSNAIIRNSAFSGNCGGRGGAMFNDFATPHLVNCTFSGNEAHTADGGAIGNSSSSPIIDNCTFTDNQASGGGAIGNTTSSPDIRNCILWGNQPDQIAGGTPALSYTVIQGGFPVGDHLVTADPRLAPLIDNGGPTMTCAIPFDSPAVAIPESTGNGNWNGCPDTDQRGFSRPAAGLRASGAYQPGIGKPALRTEPVTDITASGATSGGTFIDSGAAIFTVVLKGICWGSSAAPTIAADRSEDGPGLDSYSSLMAPLIPGLPRHVRAYAQLNDGSVIYGQDVRTVTTRLAYVVSGGAGTMDGSSWGNAYADPQVAIENATEVWVAAGTYRPQAWPNGGVAEREKHFSLRNNVAVRGGFNGTETSLEQRDIAANPVIFSGDIGAPGDNSDNCYHVFHHPVGLNLDETAILDGITITAGHADGEAPHDSGGGIYNEYSWPTMIRCTFIANAATMHGGGMSSLGGRLSAMSGCTFISNSADERGGAVAGDGTSSSALFENCTFTDNSAGNSGGAIQQSGALMIHLTNCTLTDNDAPVGGAIAAASSSCSIRNTIIWDNGPSPVSGSLPPLSWCIVEGGYPAGTNIIAADPLLGPLADNGGPTMTCAIPVDSPAMAIPKSAGGGDWNGCPGTDQRGQARPTSGLRAIGAYQPSGHLLAYLAGPHGIIAGTTPQVVIAGTDGTPVTPVPESGYHFVDWSDHSTANPRQDTSVTGPITVTANFAINLYAIVFHLDGTPGASLSGDLVQTIAYGGTTTPVAAIPSDGFHFIGWSGDHVGFDNPLTALTITSSMVITANFALAEDTARLAVLPDGHGATYPAGVVRVAKNTPVQLAATADPGCHFAQWSATSGAEITEPLMANTTVTLSQDATVTAHFSAYGVTFQADGTVGASLSGSTVQSVPHGGNCTPVIAYPPSGWHFVNWTCQGIEYSTDPAVTVTNVTANMIMVANFAENFDSLLIYEGFDYAPDGTKPLTGLAGKNGGHGFASAWIQHILDAGVDDHSLRYSRNGIPLLVVGNSAYNQLGTPVWQFDENRRPLDMASLPVRLKTSDQRLGKPGTTLWFSCLIKLADNPDHKTSPPGNISWWAGIRPPGSNGRFGRNSNASVWGVESPWRNSTTAIAYGQTVFLVQRIEYTATEATTTLWVNPTPATDPAIRVPLEAPVISNHNGNVHTFNTLAYTSSCEGNLDEFRIGTTYQAVAPEGFWQVSFQTDGTLYATLDGPVVQNISRSQDCVSVTANAPPGWSFVNWTWNDTEYTAESNINVTNVTSDMTLVANFTPTGPTVSMTVARDGLGATNPASGSYTVARDLPLPIAADPAEGWHFVSWHASPDADFANPALTSTTATLSQSAAITANFAINTYTVVFNLDGKGERSGGGELAQVVEHGSAATAPTVLANAGWVLVGWDADFSNITEPLNVTAQYELATYPLTYNAGANGLVNGLAQVTQTVSHGSDATPVTAVPDEGYHFVDWSDGILTATRQDTSVTGDIAVTANFAINVFTLTYTAGANGLIDGLAQVTQTVAHGSDSTPVTAVPNEGYHFVDWSDGILTATRQDTSVTGDIAVTANFAINVYTLTYTAGANGLVDGAAQTTQTVAHGSDGTPVTAVPDEGYHFVDWSDGILTAARQDTSVTGDIAVTANFAINEYRVEFRTDGTAGASLSGASVQTIAHGNDCTPVEALSSAGYAFIGWTGGYTGAENPLTMTSVTGDLVITATFSNVFALNYVAGPGGSVTGETTQTVLYGEDGSEVVAVPNDHHHFVQWSDGVLTAARTDLGIAADLTVTAQFAIDTFSVFFHAGANGSLTGTGTQTVAYGDDASSVTANPDAGHHFVDWTVNSGAGNGTINTGTNPLQITDVIGPIEVTANFAINEYRVEFRTDGTAGASLSGASVQTIAHGNDGTPVEALSSAGYAFLGWTGGYTGAENPLTVTNVTSDLTITANFHMQQAACGSTFAVDAGDVGLAVFNAKPKVYATYTLNGKAGKATAKVLDKIDTLAGNATLACEWTKKIRLYEAKAFKASEAEGIGAAGWVTANQQDLLMDLRMASKEIEDQSVQALALAVPVIDAIETGDPDPKTGSDTLIITGTWFGTKRPKVWREYTVPGKDVGTEVVKRQAMKVVKPTEADALLGFKDSKGKPAHMNAATGESKVVVIVPAKAPKGELNGTIVLENGVGPAAGGVE